ncbi:hypothetical protein D3C76_1093720 [compost metagenome]
MLLFSLILMMLLGQTMGAVERIPHLQPRCLGGICPYNRFTGCSVQLAGGQALVSVAHLKIPRINPYNRIAVIAVPGGHGEGGSRIRLRLDTRNNAVGHIPRRRTHVIEGIKSQLGFASVRPDNYLEGAIALLRPLLHPVTQ